MVSRILEELGHEVLVGNPRKLRMIWHSHEKSDDRDAEMLARIGRLDPELLYPIHHRGPQAQADLARPFIAGWEKRCPRSWRLR